MNKRALTVDRGEIPRSYRELLELSRSMGEAVEISDEVDWYLELGAIIRYACEQGDAEPIFDKVRGCPGFRAAEFGPTWSNTSGKRWCRLGAMLGLPQDAGLMEMQEAYLAARSTVGGAGCPGDCRETAADILGGGRGITTDGVSVGGKGHGVANAT